LLLFPFLYPTVGIIVEKEIIKEGKRKEERGEKEFL